MFSRIKNLLVFRLERIRRAGHEDRPHGGVEFNPRRDDHLDVNENDELIVLSTDD